MIAAFCIFGPLWFSFSLRRAEGRPDPQTRIADTVVGAGEAAGGAGTGRSREGDGTGGGPARGVLLTNAEGLVSGYVATDVASITHTVNSIGQRTHATRTAASTNGTERGYDTLGNRLSRSVEVPPTSSTRHPYDGWNRIAGKAGFKGVLIASRFRVLSACPVRAGGWLDSASPSSSLGRASASPLSGLGGGPQVFRTFTEEILHATKP